MRYIFDFDHTLYDTDAFVEAAEPYRASGEWVTPRIWDILDATTFFYGDTIKYLELLQPKDITVLTAWTPALGPESFEFQESKIERSDITKYVGDIIIMEGDKGPIIKELYDDEPTVFVDDRVDHLLSAKKHCPEIMVVQMIRPGVKELPTDPTVPFVNSLKEITKMLPA